MSSSSTATTDMPRGGQCETPRGPVVMEEGLDVGPWTRGRRRVDARLSRIEQRSRDEDRTPPRTQRIRHTSELARNVRVQANRDELRRKALVDDAIDR